MQKRRRKLTDAALYLFCLACAVLCLGCAVGVAGYVISRGAGGLSLDFLAGAPSILENRQGMLPLLINTAYLLILSLLFSIPLGVGAAVYLFQYAGRGKGSGAVLFAIEALSGIPSVVYGLFGFLVFVSLLGMGYSILSGSLTLAIMVLPVAVKTCSVALDQVPRSYLLGAYGLGAGPFAVIRDILLPSAKEGIVSAALLCAGRVMGESAALVFTAGIGQSLPGKEGLAGHVTRSGASLAVGIYQYVLKGENGPAFTVASAVLLLLLAGGLVKTAAKLFYKRKKGGK